MGKNIPRDGKPDEDEQGKSKSANMKGKAHHNSKIVIAFRNIINELLKLRIKFNLTQMEMIQEFEKIRGTLNRKLCNNYNPDYYNKK